MSEHDEQPPSPTQGPAQPRPQDAPPERRADAPLQSQAQSTAAAPVQTPQPGQPTQSPRPTPTRYPTDRAALERDSDLTFFVASGPGGQHRNKTETGVRLVHRPTGTTVTATERRSQYANREVAFERLAERLEQAQRVVPPRKPTRPSAASRARRLDTKRHTGAIKRLRNAPPHE